MKTLIGSALAIAALTLAPSAQLERGDIVHPMPDSLLGGPRLISLSNGGTQALALDATINHTGELYILLGSATGIGDGFLLGNVLVPLERDPYTTQTLLGQTPHIVNGIGFLDGEGKASAAIEVPPIVAPNLVGVTLYHAYVTIAPRGPLLRFSSNPVPVEFIL